MAGSDRPTRAAAAAQPDKKSHGAPPAGEPSHSGRCHQNTPPSPPVFPTGCAVAGDLAALAAGRPVTLRLQARVTVTDAAHVGARVARAAIRDHAAPAIIRRDPGQPVLVVDNFPRYVSPDDVVASIYGRACQPSWALDHPRLHRWARLPTRDIADLSTTTRAGSLASPSQAPRQNCPASSSWTST